MFNTIIPDSPTLHAMTTDRPDTDRLTAAAVLLLRWLLESQVGEAPVVPLVEQSDDDDR